MLSYAKHHAHNGMCMMCAKHKEAGRHLSRCLADICLGACCSAHMTCSEIKHLMRLTLANVPLLITLLAHRKLCSTKLHANCGMRMKYDKKKLQTLSPCMLRSAHDLL